LHATVNLVSVVSVTLSFQLLVFVLLSAFKSRGRLAAENIVLRQQLIIMCAENLIRIDPVRESPHAGVDGRAPPLSPEPVGRTLQVQERA
jgi:hypothetical protein